MSFLGELKRRNVFKAGAVYVIVAWLLVQVADVFAPALRLPEWAVSFVAFLLILGLPIALLLAWAYELTPDGVKRTQHVPLSESITHVTGQRLNYAIIGALALALAFVVIDNYVLTESARGSVAAEGPMPAPPPSAAAAPAIAAAVRQKLPNSVAVLPFTNMSPNPDDAYFAAGVHEEILNYLAKLKALNVIARTSMLRYADTQLDIPDIARELNVETVMEGSVRYAGDTVRITAQLIDPETGAHLWSEAYQREIDDIFAIQADIAMNIANALEAEFSVAEQRTIEEVPTSSPAAYALFLEARNSIFGGPSGLATAHTLLDRAIDIDPGFGRAYGLKAVAYSMVFVNTTQGSGVAPAERDALERQVREYAARAAELAPDDWSARAALRSVYVPTWRWSAYRESVRPEDEANLGAGQLWIYSWMGEHTEALRLAEQVVRLNPSNSGSHLFLAVIQAYAGDRDASNASLARAAELAPAIPLIYAWQAYNHVALGNEDEALAAFQFVEQLLGDTRLTVFLPELAYGYSRLGRRDDVERVVEEIRALGGEDAVGTGTWALAHLALGNEEQALAALERVAAKARNHEPDQGYISVMNLRLNFLDDPLIETPRFAEVLSRIRGD